MSTYQILGYFTCEVLNFFNVIHNGKKFQNSNILKISVVFLLHKQVHAHTYTPFKETKNEQFNRKVLFKWYPKMTEI